MFRPEPTPPLPGQESVWDYPRPAICEPTPAMLEVVFGGRTIARTTRGYRVLETSHPPSYYFPPEDVDAAAHAAIEHERHPSFEPAGDFGQGLDAARGAVELPPAVVGDDDAVNTALYRFAGIVGMQDALEQERQARPLAQAGEVVPSQAGVAENRGELHHGAARVLFGRCGEQRAEGRVAEIVRQPLAVHKR